MSQSRRCPVCGTEIPADTPEGLCPRCLLRAGLASQASQPTASFAVSPSFVPPTVEALARCFPQLEILELVGQGGMGAVYKARQPALDRLVALKILPPEIGAEPAFAERFTREARALAKLNHPHIVAIHDFGVADGLFYFLMAFVDGINLRQAIQQGDLQPAQALKIVPQICDALQFAHDEGIVHRDIKPENILLDKRGRVKIADFGLAKLLGVKANHALTGTRQVMGTPHYMAPEQIQGTRDVDHRADIYSLGVTFYEMLTGELPLGRFAAPSKKVQIDVRLDEVVIRTLEVEPEHRYQHASEVKTEVEQIASNVGTAAVLSATAGKTRPTLEQIIVDLLPEDKAAAIRTYRETTGAGLAAAFSAVKSIAETHGKNQPVPFAWDSFIWCLVWAIGAIGFGWYLGMRHEDSAGNLLFKGGGILLALFWIAQNVTWQISRSRWRLEDFDEDGVELEKATATTDLPAPPRQ
ncbi:MAG: serine/threonine protein kinase [Planctomycetes bacterium]|nr:serine/threonine protein kinase [Planctomycetota bacterium]